MIKEKLKLIRETLKNAPCVSLSSNGAWKSWQFNKDKLIALIEEVEKEVDG